MDTMIISTIMTTITTSIMITEIMISATTMEYIKDGEYIKHGADSQDGIVTRYEHILPSSLITTIL